MLNAMQGGKQYSHCYAWIEALCSLEYMNISFLLIAIHGMKLYAHCYTWIEALCSLLHIE